MNVIRITAHSCRNIATVLCIAVGIFALLSPGLAGANDNDDKYLNESYQKKLQQLNDVGRAALRTVQRAWVDFKEQDLPLFSRMAVFGKDRDRIERYKDEMTSGRAGELKSLGGTLEKSNWFAEEAPTAREADALLNKLYRSCLEIMPGDGAEPFKAAQRLWLQFRDLHFKFDTALRGGTEEPEAVRTLTLSRVVQFQHYMLVLVSAKFPQSDLGEGSETVLVDDFKLDPNAPDVFRFAK